MQTSMSVLGNPGVSVQPSPTHLLKTGDESPLPGTPVEKLHVQSDSSLWIIVLAAPAKSMVPENA